MFSLSEHVDGCRGFYERGIHFFAFGWEWDIGLFYFKRWR